MQRETAVVYDGLPVSSGGAHAINRLGAPEALRAWRRFLGACTQQIGTEGMILLNDGSPPAPDAAVLLRVAQMFPERAELAGGARRVPEHLIDDAIELMANISPQPGDEWGNAALTLFIEARFLLLRPGGDGLWPGQGSEEFGDFETPGGVALGGSSVRLVVDNRRSMGLMLSVPSATDADVASLRPWLQEHLPFRLSDKHWTRWTLNKNGRTYRPQRMRLG